MQSVNSTHQRLDDLFHRLGLGETESRPGPTPHEFTIGRNNPALAELKRRRSELNPRQQGLINDLDIFYDNTALARSNASLGYAVPGQSISASGPETRATLQRRASFLLNVDAMSAIPEALDEVEQRCRTPGIEQVEANAILNSVKAHTEHVMAVALKEARDGERVCPLVFQPLRFPAFLETNTVWIQEIVSACALAQPARERALKPLLEGFSNLYFDYSRNYPGAPKTRPDSVEVTFGSAGRNRTAVDRHGDTKALITIDSAGAEQFCRSLPADADIREPARDRARRHTMKGFESLPLKQKLAAFYTQSLLQELGEVQEAMGMKSADRPQDGPAAQQAARRTREEWQYQGSPGVGDAVYPQREGRYSQRAAIASPLLGIAELDNGFVRVTGVPLVKMPEIRTWLHSPAVLFDLRALQEPSARLHMQTPALTGKALLALREFQAP